MANADLVSIVGTKVKLKRAGRNYVGLCPFHQEKTPSFTVDPEKNLFYCFGCQEGGNAVHFLRRTESLDFLPAVERLAEIQGVPVVYAAGQESTQEQKRLSDTDVAYALLRHATDFYKEQLRADKTGLSDNLRERGIAEETARAYELGIAPASGTALWQSLTEDKIRAAALAAKLSPAGKAALLRSLDKDRIRKVALKLELVRQNEGGDIYDFFRNRMMFPIHDQRKRPIGFGGRRLGDEGPKYINSAESIIFSKSKEFYGQPQALEIKDPKDEMILVEGYTDVLAFGMQKRVLACLGTAFTEEHAQKLFRYTANIVLAFDGDDAGSAAALKAVVRCLPFVDDERNLSLLFLPAGDDPNSLLLKGGIQAWEQLKPVSLEEFLLQELRSATGTDAKTRAIKMLAECLALMPVSYRKTLIHKDAEDLAGISILLPEVKPVKRKFSERRLSPKSASAEPMPHRLHRMALLFLADRKLAKETQLYWAKELETAASCADTEMLHKVMHLFEAADHGGDYLYGWLKGCDSYLGPWQGKPPPGRDWIFKDVGRLLLETYKSELVAATKKSEKDKLERLKKDYIPAVKRKMSRIMHRIEGEQNTRPC